MDNTKIWTLKNLVNALDMPTTTVFRQISTLVDEGYLVQDSITKAYSVGPKLYYLSSTILGNSNICTIARPEMEKLSNSVKETVNLCNLLGNDIFYLDKVETFRSIICRSQMGQRLPAHMTSAGKVIMAYKDPSFVDAYCKTISDAVPMTEFTITSAEQLRLELDRARQEGYAMDNQECEPGLTCIGAPIIGKDRTAVAAISIAGPTFRMNNELDSMIRQVKQSAAQISWLLGGGPYIVNQI